MYSEAQELNYPFTTEIHLNWKSKMDDLFEEQSALKKSPKKSEDNKESSDSIGFSVFTLSVL